MTRPGFQINLSTSPPVRNAPTNTGVWFAAGITQIGPQTPVLIRSLSEFITKFGGRMTYSLLYDAVELYFREGGQDAYVQRVLGPNPALASLNLADRSAVTSLIVRGESYGDYYNGLSVEVQAGTNRSTVRLLVTLNGTLVDSVDNIATQQDAVTWSQSSNYVNITAGSSALLPAVAAAAPLTGGTDDHGNAVDANFATALAAFPKNLGPGQVSMPGRSSDTAHQQLLDHAQGNNRVAVCDLADVSSGSTLKASAAAVASGPNAQFGAAFAPWLVCPGVVSGTTRVIPPSALVAAKICETDGKAPANAPAAGMDNGVARWVIDLSQTFTDATFDDLSANGVNVIVNLNGGITIFGWDSLVDPEGGATDWINFGSVRLYMQISAILGQTALRHAFKLIDGAKVELGSFYKDLVGDLLPFHTAGALFGATPGEAFAVDVDTVNTPETIANRELHATVALKMSEFAEEVVINIVKTALSGSVI